jgi:acyl-CoA synthetase (AMP-forming)/AMP-acid ligase II
VTVASQAAVAQLSGPRSPAAFSSLEEIVRPFSTASRGISVVGDKTRTDLSYRDLAGQTAAAAARLRRSGVAPGALVAMTVTNDLPSVLAVLATWAAGATLVSVPPPPRNARDWYGRQFGPVLEAAGCAFLVGDEGPADDLAAAAGLRRISKLALAEPEHDRVALPDVAVPDTALIQFTSGSIGTPKGVAISATTLAGHLAVVASVLGLDGETDRMVSWLPLYHDMGLVAMFLGGLAARVDQVLAAPAAFATRPASWLSLLAAERATVTAAPNFAYRLAAAVPYDEPLDLSRLRVAVCGGERVSWQALQDFHAAAGPMGFRWEALMPCYGLAEGTVAVTCPPLGRGPVQGPGGHVSVGRPVAGVSLRAPAAPSAAGPVQLGGDWLLSGYHAAAGFQPAAVGGWFDTGDAGFAAGDELYVLGRRDEVLSLAGRNVFAEDVEAVTQQAGGPLVSACAAFRNPAATDRLGLMVETNPRLVKDRDDASRLGRLIRAAVADIVGTRLTPVLVVRLGVIPRTTSGKVRRSECRARYNSGEISRRIIAELT